MLLSETNKYLMLIGYKHTANNHCFSFNIHAKYTSDLIQKVTVIEKDLKIQYGIPHV